VKCLALIVVAVKMVEDPLTVISPEVVSVPSEVNVAPLLILKEEADTSPTNVGLPPVMVIAPVR
jgi:hypothetical protein